MGMGDNLYAFDTSGNPLDTVINKKSLPSNQVINKLRDMKFGPDGLLYVASSSTGVYSSIIALHGNGLINGSLNKDCTRNVSYVLTKFDARSNPYMDHPYSFLFHPKNGILFVSNQNTVTITRYYGPQSLAVRQDPKKLGTPAPWSMAMIANDINNNTSNISQHLNTSVGGVFAAQWDRSNRLDSVRGIALSPALPPGLAEGIAEPGLYGTPEHELIYYLLVCDITANQIAVYDPDSGFQLWTISVPSPVQVYFPQKSFARPVKGLQGITGISFVYFTHPEFFVTSKTTGAVYRGLLAKGNERLEAITPKYAEGHAASGFVEFASMFLIAGREKKMITSLAQPESTEAGGVNHAAPSSQEVFRMGIGNQPEFLLYVQLESPQNIPFCQELFADGSFRDIAWCKLSAVCKVLFALSTLLAVLLYVNQDRCYQRAKQRVLTATETDEEGDLFTSRTQLKHSYGTV